jgi:predicted DCC family thiol-disulfide oxidoreductase YuxK
MLETSKTANVILFDGVCNLCSGIVQFVIKHDKKNVFKFASLQSTFGQTLLKNFDLPASHFNSFTLYQNGKIYTKSTGALMVARHLSGAWSLLYPLMIIPRFIRDFFYNVIAANRYKWFGKKEECWVPSPALKIKFFN